MFILPHGTWKDNIRSVNFDWRQRSSGRSSKGERSAGLSNEGRDPLVTQADLSAPRVCFPAVAQLHKKDPCHRRKICVNSLWLCSFYTQSSLLKNKSINYVFIYLGVLRCLSCGLKCNTINITWSVLLSHQKFNDRPLFNSETHWFITILNSLKTNIFWKIGMIFGMNKFEILQSLRSWKNSENFFCFLKKSPLFITPMNRLL